MPGTRQLPNEVVVPQIAARERIGESVGDVEDAHSSTTRREWGGAPILRDARGMRNGHKAATAPTMAGGLAGSAEQVNLQELVPKLALGVESARRADEIAASLVPCPDAVPGDGEQLGPMGPWFEWSERSLDVGQQVSQRRPVGLPREVESNRWPIERGTQPEVVAGDRSDLGHLDERGDAITQRVDCREGPPRVLPRDDVLALELVAAAWSAVDPE